jgi:hypothetical protein
LPNNNERCYSNSYISRSEHTLADEVKESEKSLLVQLAFRGGIVLTAMHRSYRCRGAKENRHAIECEMSDVEARVANGNASPLTVPHGDAAGQWP